ncbi:hypothetical protein HBA54_00010 [Pelagibius litoralis]|uniref:N-acetyltransferase domain-containing protein n=1 Tax=Pelagibius litoralis TaxID=374515 RepID=A0A967C2D5_9PROT|nr:hypothetical protein [Pelagibius litoralis]NIA66970.1 hypothetical protein [Pelagibius litoralis]
MKGPQIVAFEPAHLIDIDPPVLLNGQMQRFAAAYRPAGPAFTLVEKGRALGCGGLILDGKLGHAWAFLSDALRRRPQLLHRTVRRALPALIEHYELEAVTAEAHVDFAAAQLWLKRLGFEFEEIAPRFAGTTENYVRYKIWLE